MRGSAGEVGDRPGFAHVFTVRPDERDRVVARRPLVEAREEVLVGEVVLVAGEYQASTALALGVSLGDADGEVLGSSPVGLRSTGEPWPRMKKTSATSASSSTTMTARSARRVLLFFNGDGPWTFVPLSA